MNKKTTYAIIGVVLALVIIFFTYRSGSDESTSILVNVTKGVFVSDINVTGELESRNSVKINVPAAAAQYRLYNMTVQNIIPEGTRVKKGQFVVSLDPSELAGKIKDLQIELSSAESEYITAQLDTTLEMREKRDELINLKYAVEEKEIELEQSQFEPPAQIKKTEIAKNKAIRTYDQKVDSYKIKQQQNIAKMVTVRGKKEKVQNEIEGMSSLMRELRIMAPEDGMLIYAKSWNGQQIKSGSRVSPWDPVVATLPDLSSMNTKTFVNEVDIRKVKKGQKVEIGLDALPDKSLTGVVSRVANSGQKIPNSDSKVFEVMVEVDKVDGLIKPGMTTSNKIFTSVIEETLSIPLECLHNYQDSITYVYVKNAGSYTKQEIQVGETNNTLAQVLLGLDENDKLYISTPEDNEDEIKLLPELEGKRNEEPELSKEADLPNQFPRKPKSNS